MDDPYAVGRRGFLRTGATAAAAAAVACGKPTSPWRTLTEDEARTLAAACDQIVPPDQDPGAAEAGAVAFVDRQLATRRKKDLPLWRAGLRGLDATARRHHGRSFAELAFEGQTAVLADVEKGAVEAADWRGVEPPAFFAMLRSHTMMAFYGDPRHGGNKDRVSWKMLGVPDPPVRGRLHETPPPPALAPRPAVAPAATRKG
ncbi:MAG TPA: gluconate 2-dehydrogenase subunit 3 family protein [Vicinamibacteria bacterium]|nr:gluconate 2-dehydrogenase subunit 3 family protein [Vicinamibacteria bacterium]